MNILYCSLQPDSFYFNILPFAEDVREFQFRSFSRLPPSLQPTEEQQEATDYLVKILDLAPPGREEILRPDFPPNPMLEVEYCFHHFFFLFFFLHILLFVFFSLCCLLPSCVSVFGWLMLNKCLVIQTILVSVDHYFPALKWKLFFWTASKYDGS
jgi:hypothetical protein